MLKSVSVYKRRKRVWVAKQMSVVKKSECNRACCMGTRSTKERRGASIGLMPLSSIQAQSHPAAIWRRNSHKANLYQASRSMSDWPVPGISGTEAEPNGCAVDANGRAGSTDAGTVHEGSVSGASVMCINAPFIRWIATTIPSSPARRQGSAYHAADVCWRFSAL